MIGLSPSEQPRQPIKNVDFFIDYSATPFAGKKLFTKSERGLKYASLPHNNTFKIPEVKPGDARGLAENIIKRYSDGIMLDSDGLIGNICNWAHCQDVPAIEALKRIDKQITSMGLSATDYQKRLRTAVQTALREINFAEIKTKKI